MSNSTIELKLGDGDYTFALPLPQIQELQRKCGDGIGKIYARVLKGCIRIPGEIGGADQIVLAPGQAEFYALDVIETVRHGLIGGGRGVVNGEEIKVSAVLATKLVDTYVLGHPLADSWSLAVSILGACIVGYDPPKKDEPGADRATETPTTDISTTA